MIVVYTTCFPVKNANDSVPRIWLNSEKYLLFFSMKNNLIANEKLGRNFTTRKMRVVVSLFSFIVFFAITKEYYREIYGGGNDWKTGDWLINYQGGLVRRGFIGEIAFSLSLLIGGNLKWIIFFIQSLYYLVIYCVCTCLFFLKKRGLIDVFVLLSPAYLLFPFYDYQGGFRKEILGFLPFVLLVYFVSTNKLDNLKAGIICLLYFIATVSHELNSLTIPFFIYAINRCNFVGNEKGISPGEIKAWSFILILISLTGIILAFGFQATALQQDAICRSVINSGLSQAICGGAISWLSGNVADNMQKVWLLTPGYLYVYGFYFILCSIPIVCIKPNASEKRLLAIGLLLLSPLFAVGLDWGRWIYIFFFYSYSTLLHLKEREGEKPVYNWSSVTALVAYSCLWNLMHCGASTNNMGLGLISKLGIYSLNL